MNEGGRKEIERMNNNVMTIPAWMKRSRLN